MKYTSIEDSNERYEIFLDRVKSEFLEKYPILFPDEKLPVCGFQCGYGWFPLLDKLCQDITEVVNSQLDLTLEQRVVPVAQVKEKFGGLRFYLDGCHESIYDKVHDLVNKAESESFKICEECGKPGKPQSGGWIKTLCPECENEEA